MTTSSEIRRPPAPSDLAACQKLIRHGSHSFFLASRLLPKSVGVPAVALYAFCRVADDLIDADAGGSEAVEGLRSRLNAMYQGNPGDAPEDRALTEVIHHFEIPQSMLEALLEGLAWDASDREYQTLSELYDYAARVAGCVGAIMTLIMRSRDSRAIARACDLGVAMQLTNISRDVGEDARMGRLYLPRQWFADANMDANAWLANPVPDPRVEAMTKRLLGYAELLYRRADSGIALLPLSCRPGIRAARVIYSDIGREIAQYNYATLNHRAIVPKSRKLWLLAKSAITIPLAHPDKFEDSLEWPPLVETRYLLDDVESEPYQSRIEWLVSLFTNMKERDQQQLR